MHRRFVKLLTILAFGLMLLFPGQVFLGASRGLLLWFHSVLPTLLPFIIASNLLMKTRSIDLVVRISGPLLGRLFCISDYGSFAVVAGFLCGYPMGSKVTCDLLCEGHISCSEAQYLLSFCNNASPMFIISYVVMQNLGREDFLLPALTILIAAPVLSSFLFRSMPAFFTPSYGRAYKGAGHSAPYSSGGERSAPYHSGKGASDGNNLMDSCIMNGFEIITKVGGYIMLFSILLSLAQMTDSSNAVFRWLFLPSLEMTNGISLLCSSTLTEPVKFFLCMVCTSFGGWCAAAQTRCILADTGLSVRPYIIQKLITAMVTSLLALFYIRFLY